MSQKPTSALFLFCIPILLFKLIPGFADTENIKRNPAAKQNVLSQRQPVFTFTAGTSISRLGQTQSFSPLDLCMYQYKPHGSNTTGLLLGGFVGTEINRFKSFGIIAGLSYYRPNSFSTKGSLIQGVDALSNSTYRYQYETQSQQVLVESKLYWIAKENIHPFLMLGLGASFNRVSHYQTDVPPFLEFTPNYFNHSQGSFTYALGPGIDVSLTRKFRMGIAYRFTDFGAANTGTAQIDGIPISSTLKQTHLYANQVLLQFTFIPWKREE